jgi:hypothetical protein
MGRFLSRRFASVTHLFSLVRFLCSISQPLLRSDPRAGAAKVGHRTNLSACSDHARPHLDGSEHDGTLAAIGMDDQRGACPSGADHRAATLYSVGPQGPDHDAVMRIGGELLGGGPILETGVNTMACFG